MTSFKKAALEMGGDGNICAGDGYRLLLNGLEKHLKKSGGKPVSPDSYLKEENSSFCLEELLASKSRAKLAKKFLKALAANDENKQSISAYDVTYAIYQFYGEQWQEDWLQQFSEATTTGSLGSVPNYSLPERIRIIGAPILDASASKSLKSQSSTLLQSLATYVHGSPADSPLQEATEALDYYWNQKDPAVFLDFLGVSLNDFLLLDAKQRSEAFRKAIQGKFPTTEQVKELFKFLTREEALDFAQACFQSDALASFPIFETVKYPQLVSGADQGELNSKESDFFPNLAQDFPYDKRQALIDEFLGEPILLQRTNFWQSAITEARTTIKKYQWIGNTEVFSIESGNPGPTTLVFAPHFHEDNPRKMFHWIKDIPLQSGRIILLPEANRAMGEAGLDTNPMNGIFDEALTQDRFDYLVVRRVEYLMGLCDGMVGLHDAWRGPFYISDLVLQAKDGNRSSPGPVASPWVPEAVTQLQELPLRTDQDIGHVDAAQVQWQIAQYSRERLEALSGETLRFEPEDLAGPGSASADSATGYVNFHLGKPAMTFEGRKKEEHGQLLAMALYTMLLGFGHQIDPSFEELLSNAQPTEDPELYQGLPITLPETQDSQEESDPPGDAPASVEEEKNPE